MHIEFLTTVGNLNIKKSWGKLFHKILKKARLFLLIGSKPLIYKGFQSQHLFQRLLSSSGQSLLCSVFFCFAKGNCATLTCPSSCPTNQRFAGTPFLKDGAFFCQTLPKEQISCKKRPRKNCLVYCQQYNFKS